MEAVPNDQITVYYSSVSGNMIMKRKQQHIFDTLDARKIEYMPVDVAASSIVKEVLRTESPRQLDLPQIWLGKGFIGGHEEFENAVEGEYLMEFLGFKQKADVLEE